MTVSMTTRTILYDLVKAIGPADYEGAIAWVESVDVVTDGAELAPAFRDSDTMDASGEGSLTVVVPSDSSAAFRYKFWVTDSSGVAKIVRPFHYNMSSGGDISFSAIYAAAGLAGTATPSSLTTLIDAHEAAADPHDQYMTSAETDTSIATHAADDDAHHAPVSIGTNTASALSLSGQVLSLLDKFLQLTGGTLSGNLTLGAAVDLILSASSEITGGVVTITTTPGSDGDIVIAPDGTGRVSVGNARLTAVANAAAATDAVSRQFGDSRYVNVDGDTMTGALEIQDTSDAAEFVAQTLENLGTSANTAVALVMKNDSQTMSKISTEFSFDSGLGIDSAVVYFRALQLGSFDVFLRLNGTSNKIQTSKVLELGDDLDVNGQEIIDASENTVTGSISSGTLNLSARAGNCYTVALNQNVTSLVFSWPGTNYSNIEVIYTQDATGGRTVSHTGLKGRDSTAPDISTTANAVSRVIYSTPDGGTTVYADLVGKDYGTIS